MSRKALAFVLAFCVVALVFLTLFVLYATVWKNNNVQNFDEFISDTLLTENTQVKNQSAEINDINNEWLSPLGILGYTVYDFDNDGNDELLVARSVAFKVKTDAYIYLDMYEIKYGKVKLSATKAFAPYRADNLTSPSLTTKLTEEVAIHINTINSSGKNYIVCEESHFDSAFSDSSNINYWMLEYSNNSFKYIASFTQTAGDTIGFEFTGYDFSDGSISGSNVYYRDYTFEENNSFSHFGNAVSQYFSNFGIVINDYTATCENTVFRYFNSILSANSTINKCCNIYNRRTVAESENYKFEFTIE